MMGQEVCARGPSFRQCQAEPSKRSLGRVRWRVEKVFPVQEDYKQIKEQYPRGPSLAHPWPDLCQVQQQHGHCQRHM